MINLVLFDQIEIKLGSSRPTITFDDMIDSWRSIVSGSVLPAFLWLISVAYGSAAVIEACYIAIIYFSSFHLFGKEMVMKWDEWTGWRRPTCITWIKLQTGSSRINILCLADQWQTNIILKNQKYYLDNQKSHIRHFIELVNSHQVLLRIIVGL